MSADESATSEPTEQPTTQEDPADETKRKFREALAAKQGRHGEDHLDGGGKSGGHAHGQLSGKRTFRRKTG
ncbi:DUF5302 domain-containing protein [Microlunatus flavus]|uniref:DUF5302 domain-containing protein n=1 Tax=Microlunatus flavus TaxID=1036181 RepID=A0A1H9KHZ4_9ACTN|nr:DUF5302 domain-containing protein [Microlunatus flavus]SEQ98732.1 hypothetical protein SAMN05421756_107227 [Microlunatus flavus]